MELNRSLLFIFISSNPTPTESIFGGIVFGAQLKFNRIGGFIKMSKWEWGNPIGMH